MIVCRSNKRAISAFTLEGRRQFVTHVLTQPVAFDITPVAADRVGNNAGRNAKRLRGFTLVGHDGSQPGPHDLGEIRCEVERQRQQGMGPERPLVAWQKRQAERDEKELHDEGALRVNSAQASQSRASTGTLAWR